MVLPPRRPSGAFLSALAEKGGVVLIQVPVPGRCQARAWHLPGTGT